MIPRSYTAFKKSLKPDDTVRIVNFAKPWHTCTTTIEVVYSDGIQVVSMERGRHGGEQMSTHFTWPAARWTELIDDGVAFLAPHEREIWEWAEEYGGPICTGLRINVGEPWLRLTKPGYSPS